MYVSIYAWTLGVVLAQPLTQLSTSLPGKMKFWAVTAVHRLRLGHWSHEGSCGRRLGCCAAAITGQICVPYAIWPVAIWILDHATMNGLSLQPGTPQGTNRLFSNGDLTIQVEL